MLRYRYILAGLFVTSLILPAMLFSGERFDSIKKLILQEPPDQVKQRIEALAETGPIPLEDLMELSELLEGKEMIPVAIYLLEKQRAYYPRTTKLAERLARYYVQNDQSERAAQIYEELARRNPKKRDYWLRLGEIYTWNDRQLKAIESYEKAVALDSSDVETMRKLLQLYLWNDRQEEALRIQHELLRKEPDNLELWKEHGIQARWLQRYHEAVAAFKNIIRRDPKNVEAYFLLGETYLWMDRPERAEIAFRQVLKLQPDHLQARYYYTQLTQWKPFGWWQAQKNYRWILAQNPDHQESRKQLDRIRKEYGPKLESRAQTIHDSNDLTKTEVRLVHERYLSARFQLNLQSLYLRLEEVKPGGRFEAAGEGVLVGGTWHATLRTRFFFAAGGRIYDGKKSFALAQLQWQQTWPGQLYTNLSVKYDQVLDGVLAIKRRFTAQRIQQSFYWEPSSAFHIGGDLQLSRYSDQNRKIEFYTLAEYRFYSGSPQLFLQAVYGYQDMSRIYPDAVPYWTPNNFWTRSVGVDLLYPADSAISVRTGFALTQQTGNEIATNWKAGILWQPNDFTRLRLIYHDYGSRFYSYRSLQGEFSYRF
jgi:cytochrome c-type biogenesis protein CcmH/NrfG